MDKLNASAILQNINSTFIDGFMIKTVFGCIGSLIGILTNGNQNILFLIFLLYIIDLITGIIKAIKHKKFSSTRFWMGSTKIIVYGVYLTIALSLDLALRMPGVFQYGIISFIIITDSISIFENLGELGYNVPTSLIKKLKNLESNNFKNEK